MILQERKSNHSGLQGLDQSVNLVAPIIDSVQELLDTDASTPQEWYTPPQTPPFISSHVNAFDSQVHPQSDSLYVYSSIADRSTLMLVDTGASVTAGSSNFVSTFTVSPKLEPSPPSFGSGQSSFNYRCQCISFWDSCYWQPHLSRRAG